MSNKEQHFVSISPVFWIAWNGEGLLLESLFLKEMSYARSLFLGNGWKNLQKQNLISHFSLNLHGPKCNKK